MNSINTTLATLTIWHGVIITVATVLFIVFLQRVLKRRFKKKKRVETVKLPNGEYRLYINGNPVQVSSEYEKNYVGKRARHESRLTENSNMYYMHDDTSFEKILKSKYQGDDQFWTRTNQRKNKK